MKVENIPHLCAIKGTCNGQSEFSNPSLIEQVLITRKAANEQNRIIATYTIANVSDLNFTFYDYYAVSGIKYTYFCIPVINGTNRVGVSADVVSQFDNLFIGNLYEQFVGIINVEYTHSTKFNRNFAQTYYSKYPHTIINGDQVYETGNVSGVFIEFDEENCRFKLEEAGAYKKKLHQFLATPDDKVLKTCDGDIWAIQANGEVREGFGRRGSSSTTFDWTEVSNKSESGVVIVTSTGSKKVVMA